MDKRNEKLMKAAEELVNDQFDQCTFSPSINETKEYDG